MARGWIKDRFHRVAPLQVTAAAEATDVIALSLALVDQEDDALEETRLFKAEILDDNAELAAVGAFTIDGGTAAVSTDTRPALIFQLAAGGTASLDITDVVGASGATVHVKIEPLDLRGATVLETLTFD